MFNKIKYSIVAFALFMSVSIFAEEKKDDQPEINPKLIKLKVKKRCQPRKVKSKDEIQRTEGGVDYQRDDKIDYVSITVEIENKNKISLCNFQIVTLVYGRSVTEKRATPEIHSEFVEPVDELKSRGKFKKEFKCEMTYDKSDDSIEKDPEKEGDDARRFTTKAFGSDFYGYKVDILDAEGKVLVSSIWPGGLKKVIEKAKDKNK